MLTIPGSTMATELPEPALPIPKYIDQWDEILIDSLQQKMNLK